LLLRIRNPDPLNHSLIPLPSIDVLIPVAGKDVKHLNLVLSNLQKYCKNPISKIFIVTPDKNSLEIEISNNVNIFSDSEFLSMDIESLKKSQPDCYNWCVQQLIKLNSIKVINADYILWLDSDTLLNDYRTFVTKNHQLEIISDEFHKPYFIGLRKSFTFKIPTVRLSRVSHHALINTSVFKKFEDEYNLKSIDDWLNVILNSIDKKEIRNEKHNWFIFGTSSFSEYELYSLILKKYKVPRKKAYWWNESRSILNYSDEIFTAIEGGLVEKLSAKFRPEKPYSISFHSWNQSDKNSP
jgi:hypothetical protein